MISRYSKDQLKRMAKVVLDAEGVEGALDSEGAEDTEGAEDAENANKFLRLIFTMTVFTGLSKKVIIKKMQDLANA